MRRIGLLLGVVALVGILGVVTGGRLPVAHASPATSITSISVSATCGSLGGFTGTVTLDGTFTGTVQLGLFYHVPGHSTFVDSGLRADATFAGTNVATYNFAPFTYAGANTYRIQVIDAAGLGGSTAKSNSVPVCAGSPPPPPPAPCGSSNTTVNATLPGTGPFLGPLGHSTTLPTTSGTVQDYLNSCSPNGSQITPTVAETISNICAYVGPVDAAPQNQFSLALYSDASGMPGAVIASSAVGTLTADSWNCLPVPASLAANTSYWLLFWSNSTLGSSAPGSGPTGTFVCPDNAASGANGNLCYTHAPGGALVGAYWNPAALTTFPNWTNPLSAGGGWVLGDWQFSLVAEVTP